MDTLKQALVAIRDGNSQESVASLTQKLAEAKLASSPEDVAQIVQALQVPDTNPSVTDGSEGAQAADTGTGMLSALAQSLQASFFRTVDDKPQPASPHPAKQERKRESAEIVEIIPLSAVLITNASAAPVPLQGATSAIEPEKNTVGTVNGNGVSAQALMPEVNLPKVAAHEVATDSTSKADATLDALNSLKSTNDSRLNAALDAAHASLSAPANDNATAGPSALAAPLTTAKAVVNPVNQAQVAEAPVATTDTAAAANPSGMQPLNEVRANANAQAAAPVIVDKPSEEKTADVAVDKGTSDVSFTGALAQANGTQNAAPASAAKIAAYTPVPVSEQVHVAISHAAKHGIQDVTIQLDPLDLGRVEVKMHTGSDGQTQITFMVDKPSTLDSLARSAHAYGKKWSAVREVCFAQ